MKESEELRQALKEIERLEAELKYSRDAVQRNQAEHARLQAKLHYQTYDAELMAKAMDFVIE